MNFKESPSLLEMEFGEMEFRGYLRHWSLPFLFSFICIKWLTVLSESLELPTHDLLLLFMGHAILSLKAKHVQGL